MIGIDTNVLVRYLTQDDAAQAARATRFMETELGPAQQGCISLNPAVTLPL
jgi:predicted nucleic-acid-binding protein